ncbi:hypothetical protein VPH5P1C_0067 [Vibrio phage 5P1c]
MPRYDMFVDLEGTKDIVLNETGDFRFTQTIQESLAQRLSLRYKTWLGEWEFDTSFGTPYRQRIMTGQLSKQEIDNEFVRIALLEDDVTGIGEVISTLDAVNRKYVLQRIEVLCDNVSLVIPVNDPNERTNNYPLPRTFEDFAVCTLTPEEIKAANDFYFLMNTQLGLVGSNPQTGEYTWWNLWK